MMTKLHKAAVFMLVCLLAASLGCSKGKEDGKTAGETAKESVSGKAPVKILKKSESDKTPVKTVKKLEPDKVTKKTAGETVKDSELSKAPVKILKKSEPSKAPVKTVKKLESDKTPVKTVKKLEPDKVTKKTAVKSGPGKTPGETINNMAAATKAGDIKRVISCLSDNAINQMAEMKSYLVAMPEKMLKEKFGKTKKEFESMPNRDFATLILEKRADENEDELKNLSIEIIDTQIKGDKATVKTKDNEGGEDTFILIKEGGVWKVDRLPE